MANRRPRKPTHPGKVIREDLLPETGLSQTQLARLMRVSRRTVCEIVNERRRLTSDMAFRLARVFKSTPEMWSNMQQAVDLWEAQAVHGQNTRIFSPSTKQLQSLTVCKFSCY